MSLGAPTRGARLHQDGPPIGAYRSSPALRWEQRRRGSVRYLSSGQAALLTVCRHLVARGRGSVTLEQLARLSGSAYTRGDDGATVPNRGRTSDRLARLRLLGLVGYKAQRGRTGRIRLWISPLGRFGAGTTAYRRRAIGRFNDSTSPPGGYLTRERGLEASWRRGRGGGPPGAGPTRPVVGPRRGRRPPRILYAKCPAGHPARIGLAAWKATATTLEASWHGSCRRCRRPILEATTLRLELPPRPPSAGELAEPDLRRRRVAAAVDLAAWGGLSLELREQLERDYLAGPLESPGAARDSGGPGRVLTGRAVPLHSASGILATLEAAWIPVQRRDDRGEEHSDGGDQGRADRAEGPPVTI